MDAEIVDLEIHVERTSDGGYCARDAADRLVAQSPDLMELASDLGEIVRMAFGDEVPTRLMLREGERRIEANGFRPLR